MPQPKTTKTAHNGSGLDRLREELTRYLMAKATDAVGSAGRKTGDLAKRMAGDGDGLPGSVGKVLEGGSPVKAVGEQVKETVKEKAAEQVKGVFGGGGRAGEKKVTNIVELIDVGLPLRRVYDHWTEFEEFSGFMKGVVEASRSEDDDTASNWTLKVGPSKRSWQATVLEQVPDERIVWETSGETRTHGAVSFHELTPDLTRIIVVVEYSPGGFLEKTANLWRAQGRRLRLDLKHFQRYVTLGEEEIPEGWRGEIRDGEVVVSHEEGLSEPEQEPEPDADERGDE